MDSFICKICYKIIPITKDQQEIVELFGTPDLCDFCGEGLDVLRDNVIIPIKYVIWSKKYAHRIKKWI